MAKDKKKDIEIEEENEELEEVKKVKTNKSTKQDDEYEDDDVELTLEERIINIEKKANITCILTAIILVVSFLTLIFVVTANSDSTSTSGDGTQNDAQQQEVSTTYDTSMFEEIKGSDIKSLSKGKTLVLWIGRQGCSYCAAYAPVVASVKDEYKIDIKYIDYSKMINLSTGQITDQESYEAVKSLTGDGDYENYGEKVITGTPYTLVIKNNKVVAALRGYGSDTDLVAVLENAGLIK